jgi:ATP-dependent 26S proteasome regulatory subunit
VRARATRPGSDLDPTLNRNWIVRSIPLLDSRSDRERIMAIGLDRPAVVPEATAFDELLSALARLDERLRRAVADARSAFDDAASGDRFRGLYISEREVDRLLARGPGLGAFRTAARRAEAGDDPEPDPGGSRLEWLARTFDLTAFDVDALVVALAPELDLRYERLYAFLQDDVTRRRPTVDLVLTLLCDAPSERAARRSHFGARAPVIRHGLLRPGDAGGGAASSLLATPLEVDEQIVSFLLGQDLLDRRLSDLCVLTSYDPEQSAMPRVLDEPAFERLAGAASAALRSGTPLRVYLYGAEGTGKRTTAAAIASLGAASALALDTRRLEGCADADALLRLALRTALLLGVVLVVHDATQLTPAMRDAVIEHPGVTLLCASAAPSAAWRRSEVLVVPFGIPALSCRRALWRHALARRGARTSTATLDTLAERFRMTPGQIRAAVAEATLSAHGATVGPHALDAEALLASARAQCGDELEALAARGAPRHRWDDLVLPPDALQQLREICERVVHRERVLAQWGYGRRLTHGGGVNALFIGPSGTGKTMAAEVIASALGVDLFRVDLAGIVSKYIGETEKNLDRVFAAAEHANGIVFFDEADALFGKRSEVHDSHDRYANIEISYLLQKMERFDGVAILATNLRGNLDDAFIRRLAFSVHFPFPEVADRERIWRGIWPADAPVDPAIDMAFLARQFPLSGGHIKNIALAAAFLAAARGARVEMADILHATRREYQKLGKTLTAAELGSLAEQVA